MHWRKNDFLKVLMLELHRISDIEDREFKYLNSNKHSINEKQKRLLFLFLCDFLPLAIRKILASKLDRDNSEVKYVTFLEKLCGFCLVFIADLSMLFYIFMFAVQQSDTVKMLGFFILSCGY
jgi:hypothetical protein